MMKQTSDRSRNRIAELVLRYGRAAAGLRRVPVLGSCIGWIGQKLVPRESLTWVQVRKGLAAGIWLRLNSRTGLEIVDGALEPKVQDVLRTRLTAGATFYDVGANIGFFSLLGARLVGPTGRVVAFEADPENASRLREHAERNAFSWLNVEERAAWSESGIVSFARCDPASSPDRGLGSVDNSGGACTILVEATSLDDCTRRFPPPDLIKCDVEGAEAEVFRGAERLLAEKRPIIVCEVHSRQTRRALLKTLSQFTYRC